MNRPALSEDQILDMAATFVATGEVAQVEGGMLAEELDRLQRTVRVLRVLKSKGLLADRFYHAKSLEDR